MAKPLATLKGIIMGAISTSERGIAFIKQHEGFRARLYNDCAGHCTIGYGHLVHLQPTDGRPEEKPFLAGITEQQADELLRSDVRAKAEHYIRIAVKVELEQHEFDALASFTYNLGGRAFLSSTLLRKVNAGDKSGAALEFARWIHAGGRKVEGLVTRRDREAQMFLQKENA
jgi:lysozyme